MDETLLTVQEANDIEKILLQSPNASIRILKSPYSDNPVTISSDAVGEISGTSLADAIKRFRDHLLLAAPEVSVEEEDAEENGPSVE